MTLDQLINKFLEGYHLGAILSLIEMIFYLVGIALGIKGIFKLQEWNESKGRNVKMTTGIIYIIAAGFMLGLPNMLQVGSQTVFGSSNPGQPGMTAKGNKVY